MNSAVRPPWKIALQQKLDKKKEDEKRKIQEEEQRRFDALPPWKRMGMVPKSVTIISSEGTKTVSQLSTDSDTTEETVKDVVKDESKTAQRKSGSVLTPTDSVSPTKIHVRPTPTIENRTNFDSKTTVRSNQILVPCHESNLTNHVGSDDIDGGLVSGREGVNEEHVPLVIDNPFLKHDGENRRRILSKSDSAVKAKENIADPRNVSIDIRENSKTEKAIKTQPEIGPKYQSPSASPKPEAKENHVNVNSVDIDEVPRTRLRKNSVSDIRSLFGTVASPNDMKGISRKLSESDDLSRSPKSPTRILGHSQLFDNRPQSIVFNTNTDVTSPRRLSPVPKVLFSSEKSVVQPRSPKNDVDVKKQIDLQSAAGKSVEPVIKLQPIGKVKPVKAVPIIDGPLLPSRQAPKPPSPAPSSNNNIKTKSFNSSPTTTQEKVKPKQIDYSNNSSELPDQPNTAILGDGQSSLRRKRGIGKISASALINLSNDDSPVDSELSEHHLRIRTARQEARASSSKNLLKPSKDDAKKKTKMETEPTYVDTIPYPEKFRESKATNASSPKAVTNENVVDDVPRTNIDDVVLSPIAETLDSVKDGLVEGKSRPKNVRKKTEAEWIGYDSPTGKPSALKSISVANAKGSSSKHTNISFNESNLSEIFEYQSESSLLEEYLREERGMNGNPRVGNLPRQSAIKVDEDDDDIETTGVKQDNVLAHEGLQNYTPNHLQSFSPASIRQQQEASKRSVKEPSPALQEEVERPEEVGITYDSSGDYFSSAGSNSAALLF